MGQLKVMMNHATVTNKVLSKMQHIREQPDNRTQSKSNITCELMKMLHLVQHFVSDGGMNHHNFKIGPFKFQIFFQKTSRDSICFYANLILAVHINFSFISFSS